MNRIRNWATSVQAWMVALLLLIVVVAAYYVVTERVTPFTTDAYGQGSRVKKGDPLFRLDPEPYQYAVDRLTAALALAESDIKSLEAQLASGKAVVEQRQADVELAQATFDRVSKLTEDSFATRQQRDEATDKLRVDTALLQQARDDVENVQIQLGSLVGGEHSQVAQARAELQNAQYELEQTTLHAAVDGVIDNLQLQVGKYVDAGDEVMTLIDTSQWWIVANFPENALSVIRPGQKVKLSYFMYPGRIVDGEVTSLGHGVYLGQGLVSGELPDIQNPSVWITQSQRFQVRITPQQADALPLRVGATARVMVLRGKNPVMNGLGHFWLWVGAQLDYIY
jgi:multidrug resistance efflux pump